MNVVETPIAALRAGLESGATTAVALVQAYLARIDAYDGALNAVVVRNPDALAEAAEADARRARGEPLGPLDGIPYTAKDSYLLRGLTVASGSPAFAELVAQRDAFTVQRLRAAGAICLGKTNMPPMANGGMQRGLYGRAESPYNRDYLTAPFASGSSNGAGTATAARFAAFRLAEENWSHGGRPAANHRLCRHTRARRELRRLRARRGDLVQRARAGVQQRAVRLHALARRDLGARQLAAHAHDGRRGALRAHDGRSVRGPRRDRRRRPRRAGRPLAPAAVDRAARRERGPARVLRRAARVARGYAARRSAHVHQRRR